MGAPWSFCAAGSRRLLLLLLLSLLSVVLAQRVKVRDAVTGYVGEEVTLPCKFATTSTDIKVSQVTWVKEMGARKQSVAVYHPDHGPSYPTEQSSGRIHFLTPSLADATLIIGPLRMDDEGTYTCEFATYPLGNEDGVTRLIMLAKPTNTAEAREVMAGGPVTPVAVCTSAHGKPPASITWQTPGLSGNANASEVTNPDGTITVISQYNMAPVAEANEKRITCIVEHDTLTQAEALPVMLSVLYPPQVSIEGYDDNWYLSRSEAVLKCVAKGNPAPSQFSWKTTSGPLPSTVEVQGNQLVVRTVDTSANTTFICHVSNRVGTASAEQGILVRDQPARQQSSKAGAVAGGVVGVILAVALAGSAVFFIVLRRRRRQATMGSYDPKTRVFGNGAAPPVPRDFAELDRPLKSSPGHGREEEDEDQHLPYSYSSRQQEEEEQFDQLGPILRLGSSPHGYEFEDMESQHDGSIISKKAVYV